VIQVVVPKVSDPSSGSRWAATDRHKNQQDRWRSVTDCGSARALAAALTCGFLLIFHGLLTVLKQASPAALI
jgi:hypothetical protein